MTSLCVLLTSPLICFQSSNVDRWINLTELSTVLNMPEKGWVIQGAVQVLFFHVNLNTDGETGQTHVGF